MLKDTTEINKEYDDVFINDIKLPWLPWVGINFNKSNPRTIILGESTYNWDSKNPKVQERISKNNHLRILHQNHAMNPKSKSKFVRNIERAVFQIKNPKAESKQNFWDSVVYHNLVLRHMPTIKSRPKYDDYKMGWEKYLSLIKTLDIKECLVYGLEAEKYNSLIDVLKKQNIAYNYKKLSTKVGRCYPRIIQLEDISHKILFIRHPSSYFSWTKWGEIIKDHLTISKNKETLLG